MKTIPLIALALASLAGCATTGGQKPTATVGPVLPLDPDKVPFNADLRAAELRQLAGDLREAYAHLANKERQWGFTLDGLVAKYEPLVRRADTFTRYELVMVRLVCELHDAHLQWRRAREASETKRRIARLGLSTVFAGEELVVSEVWQGTAAERAGVKVGDRVVEIDGRDVATALEEYAALRAWSRREAARYDFAGEWPARRYDDGTTPPERALTVVRGGERLALRVAPETAMPEGRTRPPALTVEQRGPVSRLRLRSLRELLDRKRLAQVAEELYATADPRGGLLVDLRDNGGGYEHQARALAGHLAAHPVEGASVRVKLSSRTRAAHDEWKDLVEDPERPGWSTPHPVRSQPRAPRDYPGRIAVLVDAGCRSSCETLALLLRALGARLFGETTGGSSGAPVTFTLSWSKAKVSIPAWEMVDAKGEPVEGRGVVPDEVVTASVDDVARGRDAMDERAAAWLTARP